MNADEAKQRLEEAWWAWIAAKDAEQAAFREMQRRHREYEDAQAVEEAVRGE